MTEHCGNSDEDKAAGWQERARKDPTYSRRSYKYGQLLQQMSASGRFFVGSDGAPNWPGPPVPGEKSIVSKATAHLVPPPLLLGSINDDT